LSEASRIAEGDSVLVDVRPGALAAGELSASGELDQAGDEG
jgi:hypothetical protein